MKHISSFDIFDTCLLRKCGTVTGFYDVLAQRVFDGDVSVKTRRDFAIARKKAEDKLWNQNSRLRLQDIYKDLSFSHSMLKSQQELVDIEIALEHEMLMPSIQAKALVDKCRAQGNRIIFISDMYLTDDFIREELLRYGFYKDGDGLYVSSTCGCTKQSGELFKLAKNKEDVPFRKWHHYGDNQYNDVDVPSSLGIKSSWFVNDYTPYQAIWVDNGSADYFCYPSILAGISRSISHSGYSYNSRYCDFVVDLVAPFYCSFVFNVLKDAYDKGIRNLFFCARDAFQIFHIAEQMIYMFPDMHVSYLFISRDSLYSANPDSKLSYFRQIGLARHDFSAAIVDITTSGKTIIELNHILAGNGYCQVRGYFFLLWDDPRKIPVDKNLCYFEVEAKDIRYQPANRDFLDHLYVFENFFSLNTQRRTVDYRIDGGVVEPVFESSFTGNEIELDGDTNRLSRYFTSILADYTNMFISTGVYRFSKEILHELAMPTLSSFFRMPEVHYLPALEKLRIYSDRTKVYVPYVLRTPKVLLKLKSTDSRWWTASVLYSLPSFLRPLFRSRINKLMKL